jgi:tubulin--tyrosine ligase
MITSINGNRQAYFYKEGYLRTSCREFSLQNLDDKFVHLTNDAVQKNAAEYGKFETANKLSYDSFQRYLDLFHAGIKFTETILPKIQQIVVDSVRAVYSRLDPKDHIHNFELFGYDFMIDEDFNVWLIEVNTNPCLETG